MGATKEDSFKMWYVDLCTKMKRFAEFKGEFTARAKFYYDNGMTVEQALLQFKVVPPR